jgi:hypothetical protein
MNFQKHQWDEGKQGWLPWGRNAVVRRWPGGWLLGAVAMGMVGSSAAVMAQDTELTEPDLVELTSGNSTLRTNIFEFDQRQAWLVNGVDQLFTDLYFLNFGQDPAQGEFKLKDLDLLDWSKPTANRLTADLRLPQANLNFSLDLSLHGGFPNESSAFREDVVTLYNDGDAAIDLTLIRYLDLDLGIDGSYNNDTLTFSFEDNTLEQADPDGSRFSLTVDQAPTAVQFSEYPFLLVQLYDDSRTTLRTTQASASNNDGTAALQFDHSLAPQTAISFQFTQQIAVNDDSASVPEPATAFAVGGVGGALLLLKRARER